ncbi:L-threonine-O-3-phosphate decarboxylase [Acetobacter estunensis NRIC 0472]|uniref:threonine-phosphate decarboxylase n=1 Tax=Acetobacter estunensis TaxID=104097 RepID=A0A967B6P1_9PROT|nr:threonine-phosphate decarboxylase CobD [Acetobacter estunensis]NHO53790.1 threonine-phosphate decarboxylase [Acetobacter estunensis]GBQ20041.1 L-threonine-O-3-phosphate decarboxylase [Acetobacter estunensis NRIC 0472]
MSRVVRLPEHGGQVRQVMASFPNAPAPFIDLSTGISPYPYPFQMPSVMELTHLPEHADEERLVAAAADVYGVHSQELIVAGPGTQILIGLLPYVLPGRDVVLFGPTYSGHETAWRNAGAHVQVVEDMTAFSASAVRSGGIAVLCNPNNPDGRRVSVSRLHQLADRCAEAGAYLVVDEAYADLENGDSLAPCLPHPALIVLRSFGKSYGLPGVRLGFLLANREIAARMRRLLGSWAVGTVAISAGCAALTDRDWRERRCTILAKDMRRLFGLFAQCGLLVIGHTLLFALVRSADAPGLWQWLCRHGIVTRAFDDRPTELRFGLPRSDEEWGRLEEALQAWRP